MQKTALITDFVCVATSGKTVDGREISDQHLIEMAESYDPNVYTANIWLEHFRFNNYGQVTELKAQREGEKVKLYAKLAPSVEMIRYNKWGQGLFTSIEITPNFADSGKAYLTGLAITDSPASLGTTQLHFNRIGDQSVIVSDSQTVDISLFTSANSENKETLLNKFFNLGKLIFSNEQTTQQTAQVQHSDNNNNNEEEPMNENQFNQLKAAIETAIVAAFNQLNAKPSAETGANVETNTVEENKPEQQFATAEQVNQLINEIQEIKQAFNQAINTPSTAIPNGEPVESKFNTVV